MSWATAPTASRASTWPTAISRAGRTPVPRVLLTGSRARRCAISTWRRTTSSSSTSPDRMWWTGKSRLTTIPTVAPSTTSTPMGSRSRCRRRSPRRKSTPTSGSKGYRPPSSHRFPRQRPPSFPTRIPAWQPAGARWRSRTTRSSGESIPPPGWRSTTRRPDACSFVRGSAPMRLPATNRLASASSPEKSVTRESSASRDGSTGCCPRASI